MHALTCLAPRRTGCLRWLFSRAPRTVLLPGLGLTFSRFSIRFFDAPRSLESMFSWLWISAPESWTALPCVWPTDDILPVVDQLKTPCKMNRGLKTLKNRSWLFKQTTHAREHRINMDKHTNQGKWQKRAVEIRTKTQY